MVEFFAGNFICLCAYLLIIILLVLSIFLKKAKKYLLLSSFVLFVADISALFVLGFSLENCAIVCGICIVIVLISIKGGMKNEL